MSLEAFAAEKGVAVKDIIRIKVGEKIQAVRISAQSLAIKNKPATAEVSGNPNEVFLKKGLTQESRQLVVKKLAVVLKRLAELEQTVGDPAVFADQNVAATVQNELDSLKILEKGTLLSVIDKLDFIQKDFARFQPEFKKQFLQQDQKKEMLAQMEEFIQEFQEDRIEDIPSKILEAVETVEANSGTLTSLAQTVDDFKAVSGLSKAIGKEAEGNREVLTTLKETLAENIRLMEQNRGSGKQTK
jgi:DNA-binding phage protein